MTSPLLKCGVCGGTRQGSTDDVVPPPIKIERRGLHDQGGSQENMTQKV